MFKLPDKPSPKASITQMADFFELKAWVDGSVSNTEIIGYLSMTGDNLDSESEEYEGCQDAEDDYSEFVDNVILELEYRERSCPDSYPFIINAAGTSVSLKPTAEDDHRQLAYLYLLASTRLNMTSDRTLKGIDGALIMEKLSAKAIQHYLGVPNSRAEVFGTSAGGNFQSRVERLMQSLNEPGRYRNIDGDITPTAQDDKLDVVAWIPHVNNSPGQLIIFAQAKTGTNWRDKTSELDPILFQNKWIDTPFLSTPIKAFCVSESIDQNKWNSTCLASGLLFDRCRLAHNTIDLESEVVQWTQAAKQRISTYMS